MNKAHEHSQEDWRFAQQIAANLFREKKTPGDCPGLADDERGLVDRAYKYPTDEVLLSFVIRMQEQGKNLESVEMPEIVRLRIEDLLRHWN